MVYDMGVGNFWIMEGRKQCHFDAIVMENVVGLQGISIILSFLSSYKALGYSRSGSIS